MCAAVHRPHKDAASCLRQHWRWEPTAVSCNIRWTVLWGEMHFYRNPGGLWSEYVHIRAILRRLQYERNPRGWVCLTVAHLLGSQCRTWPSLQLGSHQTHGVILLMARKKPPLLLVMEALWKLENLVMTPVYSIGHAFCRDSLWLPWRWPGW